MSHVIFHQWHVTILCCSSIPFFPQRSKQHVIFKFVMPMAQSIKFTFHACFPCFPGSSNPNYLPEGDPWTHNMNTLIFIQKVDKFPNFHPKNTPISPPPFSLQPSHLTFLPGPWENRLQVVVRIGHARRKDMGPQATMRVWWSSAHVQWLEGFGLLHPRKNVIHPAKICRNCQHSSDDIEL